MKVRRTNPPEGTLQTDRFVIEAPELEKEGRRRGFLGTEIPFVQGKRRPKKVE